MDVAEYIDGMHAYGYSETQCREAFALFAVVRILLIFDNRLKSSHLSMTQIMHMFSEVFFDFYFQSYCIIVDVFPSLKDNLGKRIAKLDLKKWRQLYHQYYFSKDKKALGNHLFGKLPAK